MTETNPDAEDLLQELGNTAKSIPFVALFSHKAPDSPITLRDFFTVKTLLMQLDQIAPSQPPDHLDQQGSRKGFVETSVQPTDSAATAADGSEQPAASKQARPEKVAAAKRSSASGEDLEWRPFDLAEIRKLRQQGMNLIVDWTADW